jgi:hypothetical protein
MNEPHEMPRASQSGVLKEISDSPEQAMQGKEENGTEAEIRAGLLPDVEHAKPFKMALVSTLLEVLEKSAKELGVQLLPNSDKPLDRLHGIYAHERVGESLDLEITLAQFLEVKPMTHLFGVELVRAIRVNTRWLIAPEERMTPKSILALAGLSWEEYSLYTPPESTQPLPPDSDIPLSRGELFEAQRDGKYGSGINCAD